jgi:bacterioferritin-associated ferredoxin
MIVCSCHAVTDREIQRAARAGARTPCQVAEMCGAGSACGGCRETVHELLNETHGERRMHATSVALVGRESVSA